MEDLNLKSTELYSEELGIDLSSGDSEEVFKWFLASVLFGGRISEDIAKRTYREFERHDLLTPEDIVDAGFDFLVNPVMREGGYVRYDNQQSEQILRNCQTLLETYDGSLNELHESAEDESDLESRIDAFYGVGPVTVNIFLRELRPVWEKSDPNPLDIVEEAAANYDVDLDRYDSDSEQFARVEAGLIRQRHDE
jgi:endonuclease III